MAITLAPGQIVTQGDWDALFTQHGGMPNNQQSIRRPPTKEEQTAADDAGDDLDQNPIYRYTLADGSVVEARTAPNGTDWLIVAYKPSAKFQETQKPAATGAKEWRTEGTPDGQGGYDNSRPIMAAYVNGKRTGETRQPNGDELTDWNIAQQRSRNPGGKTDKEIADEKEKAAAHAERNRPGAPTLKPDGKGGTIAVQTMPDGTIKTTPLPGVPSEATSKYTEVKQDPDSKRWYGLTREGKWEEMTGGPGAGATPPPAAVGQFKPDINKPGLGLPEHVAMLSELRALGKLNDKQYEDAVRNAHATATSEASRLDTIVRQQQQIQANEISQRNADQTASASRYATSQSATQQALDASLKMAGLHTPESYAAGGGAILPAIMALQSANAYTYGGMNMPERVGTEGLPALQQVSGMSVGASPSSAPIVPAMAQVTGAPTPPNAIGAGAIGNQAAPGGMPAPLLPPRPMVPAPAPSVAPAPPISQQVRDTDYRTAPASPAVGGGGGNVQMAPVLPAVENMTHVATVMGMRPPDVDGMAWQEAVRQAALEMGMG